MFKVLKKQKRLFVYFVVMCLAIPCIIGASVAGSMNRNPVVRHVPVSTGQFSEEEAIQFINQLLAQNNLPGIDPAAFGAPSGGSGSYKSNRLSIEKGFLKQLLPALLAFSSETNNWSSLLGGLAQMFSFSTKPGGGLVSSIMQLVSSLAGGAGGSGGGSGGSGGQGGQEFLGGILAQATGPSNSVFEDRVTELAMNAAMEYIRNGGNDPSRFGLEPAKAGASIKPTSGELDALATKVKNYLQPKNGEEITAEMAQELINLLLQCPDCKPVQSGMCATFTGMTAALTTHYSTCKECKRVEIEIPQYPSGKPDTEEAYQNYLNIKKDMCPELMAIAGNKDPIHGDPKELAKPFDEKTTAAAAAHVAGCATCKDSNPASQGFMNFCDGYKTLMEQLANHLNPDHANKCTAGCIGATSTGGMCGGELGCLTVQKYSGLIPGIMKALSQNPVDEGGDLEKLFGGPGKIGTIEAMMKHNDATFQESVANLMGSGSAGSIGTMSAKVSGSSTPRSINDSGNGNSNNNNNTAGSGGGGFLQGLGQSFASAGLATAANALLGGGAGGGLGGGLGGLISGFVNNPIAQGLNIAWNNILSLMNGDGLSIGSIIASFLPVTITRTGERIMIGGGGGGSGIASPTSASPAAAGGGESSIKYEVQRHYPAWCSMVPATGSTGMEYPHRCLPLAAEASIQSMIWEEMLGGRAALAANIAATSIQAGALFPSPACIDTLCSILNPASEKHCRVWHLTQCRCACVMPAPPGEYRGPNIVGGIWIGVQSPPPPLGFALGLPGGILPIGMGCTAEAALEHQAAAIACAAAYQARVPLVGPLPLQAGPCCRSIPEDNLRGTTGLSTEASVVISSGGDAGIGPSSTGAFPIASSGGGGLTSIVRNITKDVRGDLSVGESMFDHFVWATELANGIISLVGSLGGGGGGSGGGDDDEGGGGGASPASVPRYAVDGSDPPIVLSGIGSPSGITIETDSWMGRHTMSNPVETQMMLSELGWKPGMTIILQADSTGRGDNSYAQRLSAFLTNISRDENDKPTTVIAPTSVIRKKGEEYYPVGGQWLKFVGGNHGVPWTP